MLEVKEIKKAFGPVRAVQGVSFKVEKGEILGFLGPNGAGKSTTMRMITGFLSPSAGTASILGNDITENPVEAKKHLGYLPENAPLYEEMTVTGFLKFIAELRGFRGKACSKRVASVIERCRIGEVQHKAISTLSKGYRQRVCFAQAVIHDPAVLIMDEPTDGLDPNQKFIVRNMIRDMASEKAIVISTHILEEVKALCTRVIIISNGKIVASGTPYELEMKSETKQLDDYFRKVTLGEEHVK